MIKEYEIIEEVGYQYVIYNDNMILIHPNYYSKDIKHIAIELTRGGKIILAVRK
jgi:hypothetical protein